MDFTTILDYQKLEGAIQKFQDDFQKTPIYREYAAATKAYNDVVASFRDLQAKLDSYSKDYQKVENDYDAVVKELDKVIAKMVATLKNCRLFKRIPRLMNSPANMLAVG